MTIQIALAILVYAAKIVLAVQANKCKWRGHATSPLLSFFKFKNQTKYNEYETLSTHCFRI